MNWKCFGMALGGVALLAAVVCGITSAMVWIDKVTGHFGAGLVVLFVISALGFATFIGKAGCE